MNRPHPPSHFTMPPDPKPYISIMPASDVGEWLNQHILSDEGDLYNPDHQHLLEADLCFLWASNAFEKKGRSVLGQAEEVAMRAGGWQKARMGADSTCRHNQYSN